MPQLLLFGPARDAARRRHDEIDGQTVAEVLARAVSRYGPRFESVLMLSQVWVNGESADPQTRLDDHDEVAVLPPISGG